MGISVTIRLFNPDGEQVDFDFVPDSDLKDGKERIELSMAYFGAPKVGNYTLVVENIREEVIYQKEVEIVPSKYNFSISTEETESNPTAVEEHFNLRG